MGNCRDKTDYCRLGQWLSAVIICLVFVGLGAWATFNWPYGDISKKWVSAFGLLALGSLTALFTAVQSAMARVQYDAGRTGTKRLIRCIQSASRLEALFRVLIGATIGLGAYLLANMD